MVPTSNLQEFILDLRKEAAGEVRTDDYSRVLARYQEIAPVLLEMLQAHFAQNRRQQPGRTSGQ